MTKILHSGTSKVFTFPTIRAYACFLEACDRQKVSYTTDENSISITNFSFFSSAEKEKFNFLYDILKDWK